MSVYLVTWNLNKEKPNYSKAREAIIALLDKFESKKDSGLETVRFVSTSWDAKQIHEYLRKAQDDNDRLFVTHIHKGSAERSGWLSKAIWDWIAERE